jgi:hypothetical protein
MVLIRNVFRLKFGKAKEAVAIMKEGLAIQKRLGAPYTPAPPDRHHRAVLHAGPGAERREFRRVRGRSTPVHGRQGVPGELSEAHPARRIGVSRSLYDRRIAAESASPDIVSFDERCPVL